MEGDDNTDIDESVGEKYAQLIKERRKKKEQEEAQDETYNPLSPKAEIKKAVTSSGKLTIDFNKKMQVFSEYSINSKEQ